MDKKSVVIIGAGVMGKGVAQVLVQNQYHVYIYDRLPIDTIINTIQRNIYMDSMFRNKNSMDMKKDVTERLQPLETMECLSSVDIIIENITEDIQEKKALYQYMSQFISERCVVLANTSCISITELASYLPYPGNVIGVHFMNPVPLINTVELIKGFHTTQDTVDLTLAFLSSIGKKAVLVNDLPGFVSNRISHLMMNEAAYIVQDQVASIESVDIIFRECYGHKMGPLELADLIGLDTVACSLKVLYDSYQDPKFRCCPLLIKMVNAGLLGRKSGQGFYTY
mgnify:CR=1 FL=1|jgi:3-hydroxyacyl-CoA dehydrogenase